VERKLKLLAILAHPDDESLGTGGTLARYAAEGIETYLICATRGERGWSGSVADYPGPTLLGQIREAELEAAAKVLGIRDVHFLGYMDGELDQAPPGEAVAKITAYIRRVRPDVVITFGPDGVYGHPDHIAISQFAASAIVTAAASDYPQAMGRAPHQVAKFYYRGFPSDEIAAYEAAFGALVMPVDGVDRHFISWPEWALTTVIDTAAYWPQVWEALSCHQTQLPGYQALKALPEEYHQQLWGTQRFYRVFSLVNGGRDLEDDHFAGLRDSEHPAAMTLALPALSSH
jgi:LmbE family N-acetylglucosaminyl deacetylase